MFSNHKKKSMDFFVSIGAGINQIPLINEAKKAKFQVIGVDMNASAPGFYHCDLKIQESIQDYDNIYIKLRELLFDGNISSVMTKSFGDAIVTTSFLCEKFNLPFIPFEESKKFLSKRTVKRYLTEAGINMPPVLTFRPRSKSGGIKKENFPVIVKPHDGHAKKDVMLMNTAEELEIFFQSAQPQDYLIEKYIKGDEIICAGMIHNKKYYHVLMSDKKTTPLPHFVDIMHITPSRYSNLVGKTTEVGQAMADIFSIHTAPVIMEFIVDPDGELHLIEAIPEFGGEFIPDIMIPASTGYNHINGLIKASAGDSSFRLQRKSMTLPVVIKYITGTEGILASCNTDSVKNMENVIFTRIFKHIGADTHSARTNHDRIGVIVTKGRTVEEAIATAEAAENEMSIRIRASNDEQQ